MHRARRGEENGGERDCEKHNPGVGCEFPFGHHCHTGPVGILLDVEGTGPHPHSTVKETSRTVEIVRYRNGKNERTSKNETEYEDTYYDILVIEK